MPELSLGEVLRRSHRSELLPLAAALRIDDPPRGRDRLAHLIEDRLRHTGVLAPVRQWATKAPPPPWSAILTGVGQRLAVDATGVPSVVERRVLRAFRDRGASQAQRASIDRVLALPDHPPVPADARTRLGPRTALPSLPRPLLFGFLARLLPFLWPVLIGLAWSRASTERRDKLLCGAILEIQRLRVLVARRLVIVLVGSPSSGKDAAIKALFGLDTGNVHPVAGSTKAVSVFEAPADPHIQIANTPGVGDVLAELTLETREILDQADLFLFLVNAQGGVRQRERDEFARVRQRQRPTLVLVNKIDTLRERDRERFLDDVAAKLRLDRAGVLGVAVDPLPQLSEQPLGLEPVHDWLRARLDDLGRDPETLRKLAHG